MIPILIEFAEGWFKQLDINTRMVIADQYSLETGDNTNIVSGLHAGSKEWLVNEFTDHIKDYTILMLYTKLKNNESNSKT